MHFRVRQKVVQLVRTEYDPVEKKPRASIVGRMSLDNPELSSELRQQLTAQEVQQAEAWIAAHRRTVTLKEEYAALTLAENLRLAEAWLDKNRGTEQAAAIIASLIPVLHDFRKKLREADLL